MIKYNKNMIDSLKSLETSQGKSLDKIMLIWPEFYEVKGFVLLKKNKDIDKELDADKILSLYHDRTGFEASYNEFRIEDYFEWCIGKPIDGLAMAIKLSEIWGLKLKKEFPDYKFYIIMSYDGSFTTIRFHKYRDDEDSWISINELDDYKEESIALRVIE